MQVLEMSSFPIEQHLDTDALERRLGEWFASHEFPARILAFSRPFAMGQVKRRTRARLAASAALARAADPLLLAIAHAATGVADAEPAEVLAQMDPEQRCLLAEVLPDPDLLEPAPGLSDTERWSAVADALLARLWALPWLGELLRFYEVLERQFLRRADYYMLTWEPPAVSAAALASTLQHTTGRPVRLGAQLPEVLACAYHARGNHLAPAAPGAPFLAVLFSYDMRGALTADTLHSLLDVPFDVALAVDVETVPRARAVRNAELAYNASRAAISDLAIKDTASERRMRDAEQIQHRLLHEGFHEVQVAVLVSGRTLAELNTHVAELQHRLGSRMRFTRVAGESVQFEALKLWSATPARAIQIPWMRRNLLSQGAGCLLGVIGFHRSSNTRGIFWGVDALRSSPLLFDLFRDNQAAHQVILGATGYGKTVFLNAIALRAAAEGYRVIGLDAFRNGDRVAAAADGGARCYSLGLDTPINLLDVVVADEPGEPPGSWLGKQVQAVIGQLALLLGEPGVGPDGREQYIPRRFSTTERGVLDRALLTLYQTWAVGPASPPEQMPLLGDLVDELAQIGVREAQELARDLRILLFGADAPGNHEPTTLGRSFNTRTAVDWDFEHSDITYFDFSRVPALLKAFYYIQAIGAVRRWMRDPRRDLRRKTLLQLDEFGYAAQVAAVLQLAVELCKTARKYGVGLMLIDQNPGTFLDEQSGRAIIENAAATIMFHLDDLAARRMAEAVGALTPGHVRFLVEAQPGECVAVVRQDVYQMTVQLSAREQRALVGS